MIDDGILAILNCLKSPVSYTQSDLFSVLILLRKLVLPLIILYACRLDYRHVIFSVTNVQAYRHYKFIVSMVQV